MKIDLLVLQLATVFLPGLIWARLDARYALKTKPSDTEFVIRAFIFGLVSYAVSFAIYGLLGWPIALINLTEASGQPIVTAAIAREIFFATFVGFVLAILWIYAATYKWLTRFLQRIGATKTYGDEDVWDFTFNSSVAAVEYVHFRDFEKQIVYAGWVKEFSETEKLRELVLREVKVYDFDSNLLFETPLLYLARSPQDVHIEFPYRGATP
jgi:hypothetical protein